MPAWVSPLTDKQHAQLGRICVLWGQIDLMLDHILQWAYGFSDPQWKGLEIADKPLGAKLSLLQKSFTSVGDATILSYMRELYEVLNEIKVHRNHAVHGMWGWRVDPRKESVVVCARAQKAPQQPLGPRHLPRLERALCYASNVALRAFMGSHNQPTEGAIISGMFFHGEPNTFPEFLTQWQERHPLDAATLDRSFREGQLPRLAVSLPEK